MIVRIIVTLANVMILGAICGFCFYGGIFTTHGYIRDKTFTVYNFRYLALVLLFSGVLLAAGIVCGIIHCFSNGRSKIIYALCLFLTLAFIVSIVITYFAARDQLFRHMRNNFKLAVLDYENEKSDLDFWQSTLRCCGSQTYREYKVLPDSCCSPLPCNPESTHKWGCIAKIANVVDSNKVELLIGAVLMCLFLILGIVVVFHRAF